MKKLFLLFLALLFTNPVFAEPTLWLCSNDTTVLYMVVESTNAEFFIFDNNGKSLGSSTFEKGKTDKGTEFLFGMIGATGVGAMRLDPTHVALIVTTGDKKTTSTFECT